MSQFQAFRFRAPRSELGILTPGFFSRYAIELFAKLSADLPLTFPGSPRKMSLESCGLSPLPGETRASHKDRIRDAIQEWNANRLDLFEITTPNDDLEFFGAMRFYFQVRTTQYPHLRSKCNTERNLVYTVNLRSMGPGRKGNSPLRDIDLSPDKSFFSYSYIGYRRTSVYGKNLSGPMKSLRAKFNCIMIN